MNIIKQAFQELYPGKELGKEVSIKYSGKFKPYNANVKHSPIKLQFNLSREWKNVSREVRIGLIQSLLVKIYKGKPNTGYRDLYESFIKNLSNYAPKTRSDPLLEASFNRINEKYFYGLIEQSNLVWGNNSTSKLGSYEYQTDTITISSIFKENPELIDYIMYHEVLHKKHKFYTKSGRSYHHTSKFKKAEKEFENHEQIEKKLKNLCTKTKTKHSFFSNWFK
jgi:hypothetical protein